MGHSPRFRHRAFPVRLSRNEWSTLAARIPFSSFSAHQTSLRADLAETPLRARQRATRVENLNWIGSHRGQPSQRLVS